MAKYTEMGRRREEVKTGMKSHDGVRKPMKERKKNDSRRGEGRAPSVNGMVGKTIGSFGTIFD